MIATASQGLVRFTRYCVVGVLAFLIDYGTLLLLVDRLPLLAANSVAFVIANLANFMLAHVWVFGRSLGASAVAQYMSVLVISLVGLALNDAVVWMMVRLAGADLLPAKIAATIAALVWNYAARVLFIYRSDEPR